MAGQKQIIEKIQDLTKKLGKKTVNGTETDRDVKFYPEYEYLTTYQEYDEDPCGYVI